MIYRERFKLVGNEHLFPNRKQLRPITKKIINAIDEMEADQRKIVNKIKKEVHKINSSVEVFVTGSRINGRWVESSDFDIIVSGNVSQDERERLNKINFGVRVDFRFSIYAGGKTIKVKA